MKEKTEKIEVISEKVIYEVVQTLTYDKVYEIGEKIELPINVGNILLINKIVK